MVRPRNRIALRRGKSRADSRSNSGRAISGTSTCSGTPAAYQRSHGRGADVSPSLIGDLQAWRGKKSRDARSASSATALSVPRIERMVDHAWFSELDDAQLAAVEHDSGPLIIAAGAGTGKTRTLTARVARLLESGRRARAHPAAHVHPSRRRRDDVARRGAERRSRGGAAHLGRDVPRRRAPAGRRARRAARARGRDGARPRRRGRPARPDAGGARARPAPSGGCRRRPRSPTCTRAPSTPAGRLAR